MLFIDRNNETPPKILFSKEVERENERIRKLLSEKQKTRTVRFRPSDDVLDDPGLKSALLSLFHSKCAYSEIRVTDSAEWSVGHHRPVSGAEQGKRFDPNHYAWLSYEWRNIYPISAVCARRKGAQFPVEDRRRAPLLTPYDQIHHQEEAMIIDPCRDHPEEHIAFDWTGKCRGVSARGAKSITILNLNDTTLVRRRKKLFERLLLDLPKAEGLEIFDPQAEFSGVALLALNDLKRRAEVFAEQKPTSFTNKSETLLRLNELAENTDDGPVAAAIRACFDELQGGRKATPPESRTEDEHSPSLIAENLRIASVAINNFKAIKALKFEMPESARSGAPFLMILGENATGKSTILEAIALCLIGRDAFEHLPINPKDYIRRDDLSSWEKIDSESQARVSVAFHGLEAPVELRIHESGRVDCIGTAAVRLLGYGPRRFFSRDRKRRLTRPSERIRSLFDPFASIVDPLAWLSKTSRNDFEAVARALRQVLDLGDHLEIIKGNGGAVLVETPIGATPIDRLSEGYRSIIAMMIDIMRELLTSSPDLLNARGVVLIDELETHLHPRWKMRIVSGLRRALPNVQFIASTHDPLCLRGLERGEVQVLERTVENGIERLTDLPSAEGLRADQLLTSDYFGLYSTFDPQLEQDMSELAYLQAIPETKVTNDQRDKLTALQEQMSETLTLGSAASEAAYFDALSEVMPLNIDRRDVKNRLKANIKEALLKKFTETE